MARSGALDTHGSPSNRARLYPVPAAADPSDGDEPLRTEVADPTAAAKVRSNVLLVDDRPQNLMALEAILEPLDQNLIRAESGEQALKCLLKHDFAVILLDVQMPGLDGFETARFIKRLEKTRHIPILFLTGVSTDEGQVFRGYSAGAVDYVVKPYDADVLRSKVSVFIDLDEKTRALRESEERFRKAFDHAPIGVALVSLDGRWLSVNRSLREITGYDEEALLSRVVGDLIHPDDAEKDKELARALRAGDLRSYHVEMRYLHADGHVIVVFVSVSLVQDAQGRPLHAIFQIADISERKRLEAFRSRFIDNAAHELRTPLTTIAGVAAMLAGNRDSMPHDQIEQSLDALGRQSARARELINNLLDLSQLERGLKVSLQEVRVASVVLKALEAVSAPIDKVLTTRVPEDISVFADPARLEQILVNLLSNAYRYGGGSVTLEAKQVGKAVTVSVQDDGAGIPEQFVSRMFEEFSRGPNVGPNAGSGLGLSIVRQLAAALGGEVWYEPVAPSGSCFKLRLRGT